MWLKIDQPAHEQTDGSELVAFELTDCHSTALSVLCTYTDNCKWTTLSAEAPPLFNHHLSTGNLNLNLVHPHPYLHFGFASTHLMN